MGWPYLFVLFDFLNVVGRNLYGGVVHNKMNNGSIDECGDDQQDDNGDDDKDANIDANVDTNVDANVSSISSTLVHSEAHETGTFSTCEY